MDGTARCGRRTALSGLTGPDLGALLFGSGSGRWPAARGFFTSLIYGDFVFDVFFLCGFPLLFTGAMCGFLRVADFQPFFF